MIVYSNSCSFGIVSDGKVYADFIASALGADLVNKGINGSCNDRIFRTTVRDLIEIREKTLEDVLVLISVASLYRYEYWGNTHSDNDGNFQSFQIGSLTDKNNSYPQEIKEFAKHWFVSQTDYEAMMLKLYYNLVVLTTFLKANNFKYLIWAGPNAVYKKFDEQTPFIKTFINFCNQTNIISLTDFNFCDYCLSQGYTPIDFNQFGNNGHHGELAHNAFSNYLLENYLNEI